MRIITNMTEAAVRSRSMRSGTASGGDRRVLRRTSFAGAALLAASLAGGLATSVSAGDSASWHGVFNETAAGATAGYDIHGSAKMTIGPDGTSAKINVSGLDPTRVYSSHLHNGTCASGGGGHYQDVLGPVVTPPNELWLTTSGGILEPNAGGVAHGSGTAAWQARTSSAATNARSIVVHAPGGTRIACADLG